MALGSKSGKSSKGGKSGKGKSSKKGNYRNVGSIWSKEIEARNGDEKTILNMSIDNQDPDDKYHQGTLLWLDAESGKAYRVKSMNIFPADKGPENLLNKVSLDLDNDYHVELQDED